MTQRRHTARAALVAASLAALITTGTTGPIALVADAAPPPTAPHLPTVREVEAIYPDLVERVRIPVHGDEVLGPDKDDSGDLDGVRCNSLAYLARGVEGRGADYGDDTEREDADGPRVLVRTFATPAAAREAVARVTAGVDACDGKLRTRRDGTVRYVRQDSPRFGDARVGYSETFAVVSSGRIYTQRVLVARGRQVIEASAARLRARPDLRRVWRLTWTALRTLGPS